MEVEEGRAHIDGRGRGSPHGNFQKRTEEKRT